MGLCVWLLSLHIACSRSSHVVVCISTPVFLWLNNTSFHVLTFTTLCINSFFDEHLGCLHFLAVMKNACYKYSCTGFCVDMFSFVLARIDGSYGNFVLNHLKSQMVFQSDCTTLRFHQPCVLGSGFSTLSPTFLAADFLITVTLMPGKWDLTALLFISLMARYMKYFSSTVFLLSVVFIPMRIFPVSSFLLTSGLVRSFFLFAKREG